MLVEVEERKAAQEFCAGMLWVQVFELSQHSGPHMQLLCCVLQSRNGLAHPVLASQVPDGFPPVLVRLICVAGVILGQVCSESQNLPVVHLL